MFLLVFIGWNVANALRHPDHKLAMGHDLLPSYAAGTLVRKGTPRLMYERAAVQAVESRTILDADLEMDARYGPWLNPPFFAWVFAPLSALPYRTAAAVFLCVNMLLLAGSLVLLTRMFLSRRMHRDSSPAYCSPSASSSRSGAENLQSAVAKVPWQAWALVPLLAILPLPFWQALCHQQNTFISLLLLAAATTCWRRGWGFRAGVFAGLLFFKPQLAAVFSLTLVIGLGWRALAGLALTGAALLAVTLITLPGCLGAFLHNLPPTLHWLQMEAPYNWGRQVTFQSFWRLLIQGHTRGETQTIVKMLWWLCSGTAIAGVALAAWRHLRGGRPTASCDRLIAASIAAMPLVMPYYMDYDLLLLSIPAVLFAAEWTHRRDAIMRADRWLLAAWGLFCFETFFNPGLAGHSRLNLGVPLIAMISVLHTVRCLRRDFQQTVNVQPAQTMRAIAA
ncbi:MAG TPA: glycosyltransferase family 87 protein [Tepidisphaeraceae bacterium]|nr:glycosyltransferase family 87 protein [Tepidisphaeraceae bacterium]